MVYLDPDEPERRELTADELREVDALCDEFEEALGRGERPVIGETLGRASKRLHPELLRNLVRIELRERPAAERRHQGGTASPSVSGCVENRRRRRVWSVVPVHGVRGFPKFADHVRGQIERLIRRHTETIPPDGECPDR